MVRPCWCSSASRSRTMCSLVASRLPVGSSARMILGSFTSARAMATRCCSPPESWEGRWRARSLSPTRSSARQASPSSVMLWKYCASITFSSAVRCGIRWNCWNTNPTVSARKRASSARVKVEVSTESMRTTPSVAWSRQPRIFSSVVLPDPDGPMIAIHCPASATRLTRSSAFTGAAQPLPYAFVTFSSSTNAMLLFSAQNYGRPDAPDARRRGQRGGRRHRQRDSGYRQENAIVYPPAGGGGFGKDLAAYPPGYQQSHAVARHTRSDTQNQRLGKEQRGDFSLGCADGFQDSNFLAAFEDQRAEVRADTQRGDGQDQDRQQEEGRADLEHYIGFGFG